MVLKRFLM